MLAEPRVKQKWVLNPRSSSWAKDDSKFGQRMLEKMGWSKGKGLGKLEDGLTDPLSSKVKSDKAGLGFEGNKEGWLSHFDDFNQLLQSLHGDVDKKDGDTGVASLSEKSKSSRRRVHYKKFTEQKDLSLKGAKDLQCIFGSKTLAEDSFLLGLPTINNSDECSKEPEIEGHTEVPDTCSLKRKKKKTVNDANSSMDHSVANEEVIDKKKRKRLAQEHYAENDGPVCDVKVKKKQKNHVGDHESYNEEEAVVDDQEYESKFVEEVPNKNKSKKRKKEKDERQYDFVTQNSTEGKKKKKVKEETECDFNTENLNEKKKRKRTEEEQYNSKTDNSKKIKKKKKEEEAVEYEGEPQNSSVMKKKKRKGKEEEQQEFEVENGGCDEKQRKKKRKKERRQYNLEEIDDELITERKINEGKVKLNEDEDSCEQKIVVPDVIVKGKKKDKKKEQLYDDTDVEQEHVGVSSESTADVDASENGAKPQQEGSSDLKVSGKSIQKKKKKKIVENSKDSITNDHDTNQVDNVLQDETNEAHRSQAQKAANHKTAKFLLEYRHDIRMQKRMLKQEVLTDTSLLKYVLKSDHFAGSNIHDIRGYTY